MANMVSIPGRATLHLSLVSPAFDVHLCLVNSYLFAFQAVSGGEFAHNMRAMFVCIADQHGFCLALGDVYVMSMCLCFL